MPAMIFESLPLVSVCDIDYMTIVDFQSFMCIAGAVGAAKNITLGNEVTSIQISHHYATNNNNVLAASSLVQFVAAAKG